MADAIIAEYLCKGIETALLSPDQARTWADSKIQKDEHPHYAFIEISLSRSIPELISALREIPGERNQTDIGKWLLAKIKELDAQTTESLANVIRTAMLVCRHCGLSDDIYYEFDLIDDALFLARHNQYGSVAECRNDFLNCLQKYAQPCPEFI